MQNLIFKPFTHLYSEEKLRNFSLVNFRRNLNNIMFKLNAFYLNIYSFQRIVYSCICVDNRIAEHVKICF